MSPVLAHIVLAVIVALSIVLMLIRPRGIAEVYWVGGGALLLVVLRLISLQLAARAIAEGSDVYLFLIGMMLLSGLARAGGTLQAVHANSLLADAVLIGVDLGPNLSVTGSLATILWLLALRKE